MAGLGPVSTSKKELEETVLGDRRLCNAISCPSGQPSMDVLAGETCKGNDDEMNVACQCARC